MKLSLGDKTFRCIRFLFGLRNQRVQKALLAYGFKQEDREEGWALIHALGKGRMAALPSTVGDVDALVKLDAWENEWFPIAQAALERRFPAVAAKFFLNLTQTEGPGVAISVQTFVDRYDELSQGAERFGTDASKALERLVARGVNEAVIAEAKRLIKDLTLVAEVELTPTFEQQEEDLANAEAAMWAWYLEWSKIARVAIKQRGLLKQLGFLNNRRGDAEDQESEAATDNHAVAAGSARGASDSTARAPEGTL